MQPFEILVHPDFINNQQQLLQIAAKKARLKLTPKTHLQILKQSIDSRMKMPHFRLLVTLTDSNSSNIPLQLPATNVGNAPEVHIIGAGPAGYFAAIELIAKGLKPVVFERGTDVRSRRRDLASLNRNGIVNQESNYCFGEGGAGTYSDGKLYTRSGKRGDVDNVLKLFVAFGANPDILVNTHPHIGTNKLPQIIAAMRSYIVNCGGEIHFNHKLTGIIKSANKVSQIELNTGQFVYPSAILLATGHSARDIFYLLHHQGIAIEPKPFAIGVRIEHPQALIDNIFYHHSPRHPNLPPASFKLLEQVQNRGVYSFCMCPGGIIAPCATNQNEIVTNGWSPSKRNNEFANSGFVVEVSLADAHNWSPNTIFPTLELQSFVEHQANIAGGGNQVAPAQKITDFLANCNSSGQFKTSYQPGHNWQKLNEILPQFISSKLAGALKQISLKYPEMVSNQGVMVAPESRTSSPIRIPREQNTGSHPQFRNLFPTGEGAGYAGGIVSAAIDGINQANNIAKYLQM